MSASPFRAARLAALRDEIARIETAGRAAEGAVLPFGIAEVDARLAGGGLALAALHEAAAAGPSPTDDAAVTLFLARLAARAAMMRVGGQVLWAQTRRDLFAPGLAQAGLGPERLLHAECRNDEEVLAVLEEGARHGSLAAIIGEAGRVTMPAARRLQLAAEEGGTSVLLLRRWKKLGADPLALPSAAVTRWRLAAAPSAPPPYGIDPLQGMGRARWRVMLVRQRGGPPHEWLLEAPDAEARLNLAPGSGDRPDQAGRAHRIAA
ncbi:MAG: ImuA family protein [Sphingosinicella sp.]|uniref:ImuA family protein n=1 Tax=Sphingosinicella sp. TaxID=1917971 RepID=UPI0040383D43